MERPRPVFTATEMRQHIRRTFRLQAACSFGRTFGSSTIQGPRIKPTKKIQANGSNR